MFLGFIQIHILHHASREAIYGLWMLDELANHGYHLSAGMLYPLLHSMENQGLLSREDRLVDGKIRKYYTITPQGAQVLAEARQKARELFQEVAD
nr:PadR family transcriptional regulator [Sulfobacillus harzensis]